MPETIPAAPFAASRRVELRHVQLARAIIAALAAAMITFSGDHSAAYGLAVFSGFAIVLGIVMAVAAWLTYTTGRRWPAIAIAAISLLAGMVTGFPSIRSTPLFFVVVIGWALATGLIEAIAGWRERAAPAHRAEARDALTAGIVGVLLGLGLLLVPMGYRLDYYIADAQRSFTLTGTSIAVGLFGIYAAIIAVYLGIAAFSPRRDSVEEELSTPIAAPGVGEKS